MRISGIQEDTGRGLDTLVAKRDGDIVCGASALFWDDWGGLVTFLDAPGNAPLRDRVVQIDGVKRMQHDRTVWAVLVGVCQFAQHFVGYRPRANCVLEFDPSHGFNNDTCLGGWGAGVSAAALGLKIATRNGAGVSAGSPLLLNYGVSFDLGAPCAQPHADTAAFKGALDALFESQRSRLPDEAASNEDAAKQEAEEKAKRDAEQAEQDAKQQAQEQERKRKLDAEQAQGEEDAKKRKAEEEALRKAFEADNPKQPNKEDDEVFNCLTSPSADVTLRGDAIYIVSKETATKKIAKDTVLVSWLAETGVKSENLGTVEWEPSLKSEVVVKDTMKRYRLDKLLKEVYPQAGEIYKHKEFPAGTLPKVLVKNNPQTTYSFYSKAKEKEAIHKFINAAKDCTLCSVFWIVKLSSSSTPPRLEPCGLAVVSNKQMALPGNGELCLKT